MKTVRIAMKEPGKAWESREVEDTLPAYQKIVGGYIEHFWDMKGLSLFCNENGKFEDLKFNFRFFSDQIFGTVFAVRSDEDGEFQPVTDADLEYLKSESWRIS